MKILQVRPQRLFTAFMAGAITAVLATLSCAGNGQLCDPGGLELTFEALATADEHVFDVSIVAHSSVGTNSWRFVCSPDGALGCGEGDNEGDNNVSEDPALIADSLILNEGTTLLLNLRRAGGGDDNICDEGPSMVTVSIKRDGEPFIESMLTPEYETYCTDICGSHSKAEMQFVFD